MLNLALCMQPETVSCRRWKLDLQLNGKGKEGSRLLALRLFPTAADLLKRVLPLRALSPNECIPCCRAVRPAGLPLSWCSTGCQCHGSALAASFTAADITRHEGLIAQCTVLF